MSGLSLVERLHSMGAAELAEDTAKAHGLTLAALLSPRRYAPLVTARRALYVALRARGWSYPLIGYAVGKDHQTIMHAVGAVRSRYVPRRGKVAA